jgi:hypothetical protein
LNDKDLIFYENKDHYKANLLTRRLKLVMKLVKNFLRESKGNKYNFEILDS